MLLTGVDDELRQLLLEHYRHPRHRGEIEQATHHAHVFGRMECGEEMEVALNIQDDVIIDAGFIGDVCSVAQTTASVLAEQLIGRTVSEAQETISDLRHAMAEELCSADLGDIAVLARVRKFPGRVGCVLMVCRGLEEALAAEDDKLISGRET